MFASFGLLLALASLTLALPFYCGVAPGAKAPRLPTVADPTATLVQVHAIWRHGDRSPANPAQCWPDDTAVWNCDSNMVSGNSMNNSAPTVPTSGAAFVRIQPVDGAMFFAGNCAVGQLTAHGYEQEVANGRALADAYVGPGKLLSPFYSPNEARFEADTSPRVQSSTIGVIQGMYAGAAAIDVGPIGASLPVADVYVRDDQTAINCPNPAVCPGLSALIAAFENSTELAQFAETTIAPLFGLFESALNVTLSSPLELMNIFDCYFTHTCWDFAVPSAVPADAWDALYSGALNASKLVYNFPTRAQSAQLSMGPWIAVMLQRAGAMLSGDASALPFYGWGSHDLCVMPLLAAFGLEGDEWCPYAGLVVFELYKTSGGSGAAVRLIRYGEPVTIPGCDSELCDWATFSAIAGALTPTAEQCTFSFAPAQ